MSGNSNNIFLIQGYRISNLFFHIPLPEHKPKQAHPSTQVLRAVLRPSRGQKYPYCSDEQSSASDSPHAHQIRPKGLHL